MAFAERVYLQQVEDGRRSSLAVVMCTGEELDDAQDDSGLPSLLLPPWRQRARALCESEAPEAASSSPPSALLSLRAPHTERASSNRETLFATAILSVACAPQVAETSPTQFLKNRSFCCRRRTLSALLAWRNTRNESR